MLERIKADKQGHIVLVCLNCLSGNNTEITIPDDVINDKYNVFNYCNNYNIDTTCYEIDTDSDDIEVNVIDFCIGDYLGGFEYQYNEDTMLYNTTYKTGSDKNIKTEIPETYKKLKIGLLSPYWYNLKYFIDTFKPVMLKTTCNKKQLLQEDIDFIDKYNRKLFINELKRIMLKYN